MSEVKFVKKLKNTHFYCTYNDCGKRAQYLKSDVKIEDNETIKDWDCVARCKKHHKNKLSEGEI